MPLKHHINLASPSLRTLLPRLPRSRGKFLKKPIKRLDGVRYPKRVLTMNKLAGKEVEGKEAGKLLKILLKKQDSDPKYPKDATKTKFVDPFHLGDQLVWMIDHGYTWNHCLSLLEKHVEIKRLTEQGYTVPVADTVCFNRMIQLAGESFQKANQLYGKMIHYGRQWPTLAPDNLTYFLMFDVISKNLSLASSREDVDTMGAMQLASLKLMSSLYWETTVKHFGGDDGIDGLVDDVLEKVVGKRKEQVEGPSRPKLSLEATHVHLFLQILIQSHSWSRALPVYRFLLGQHSPMAPWLPWIVQDARIMEEWNPWTRTKWRKFWWKSLKSLEHEGGLVDLEEVAALEPLTVEEKLDMEALKDALMQEEAFKMDSGNLTVVYTHLFQGLAHWNEKLEVMMLSKEWDRLTNPPKPNPAVEVKRLDKKEFFHVADPLGLLKMLLEDLKREKVKLDSKLLLAIVQAYRKMIEIGRHSKPSQRHEMWQKLDGFLGLTKGGSIPSWLEKSWIEPFCFKVVDRKVDVDAKLLSGLLLLGKAVDSPRRGVAMIAALDPKLQITDAFSMDNLFQSIFSGNYPRKATKAPFWQTKITAQMTWKRQLEFYENMKRLYPEKVGIIALNTVLKCIPMRREEWEAKWGLWDLSKGLPNGIPESVKFLKEVEGMIDNVTSQGRFAKAWMSLIPRKEVILEKKAVGKFAIAWLKKVIEMERFIVEYDECDRMEKMLKDVYFMSLVKSVAEGVKLWDALEDEELVGDWDKVDVGREKCMGWLHHSRSVPRSVSELDRKDDKQERKVTKVERKERSISQNDLVKKLDRSPVPPQLWKSHPSTLQTIQVQHEVMGKRIK